jgi:hypothetical protein
MVVTKLHDGLELGQNGVASGGSIEATIGGDPGGETRLEVVLRAAAVGGGDTRD